jgi:hypothetical protein
MNRAPLVSLVPQPEKLWFRAQNLKRNNNLPNLLRYPRFCAIYIRGFKSYLVERNLSLSYKNPEALFETVIVRLGGEIGIKSAWTRRTYEKRLIKNIKATLKHHNIH